MTHDPADDVETEEPRGDRRGLFGDATDEPVEVGAGGADDSGEYRDDEQRRTRRRRGGTGCILALVILLALGVLAFTGGHYLVREIKAHLQPVPDYAGPGLGSVTFQVTKGETALDIGAGLVKAGVVASTTAFDDAARSNPKSVDIQVGYYHLKKKMKASQALSVLVNPQNLIQSLVLVREGARVRDVVASIVANTSISKKAVVADLKHPSRIGLPAEAHGNPEGYLFPATYSVAPHENATQLLSQMVAKSAQEYQHLHLSTAAPRVGLTPEQVVIVASILEYEANRNVDYPRVARVIYNRLKIGMPLQLDSTVSYVSKRKGDVWTTNAQRASNSAYNTYKHVGLPPGPIGSPGTATIEAALHPAKGRWLYFVPDFQNGTTHFSVTYAEHLKWVRKAQAFCRRSPSC